MKAQSTAGVFFANARKPRVPWKLSLPSWKSSLTTWQKLMLPGGIVLAAAVIGGGIYFFSKSQNNAEQVAGETETYNLPKEWLTKYFNTENENDPRVGGGMGDPDDDILTNIQEYLYGTDPTKDDTDGDGDIDSYEIANGQSPNGESSLAATAQTQDYYKQLIEGNEEYLEFSQTNIEAEVNKVLKPDQAVVFDFPSDEELIISKQNDPAAYEKYFEDVKGLMTSPSQDFENVQTRLFDDMSDTEIDSYIATMSATEDVLKKVPVPSEIVNIQKLKIAGIRAGIRMFELVRDRYDAENVAPQFWTDLFNQLTAIETASSLEMAAWKNLGDYLKDTGGWEEIGNGGE